MKLIQRMETPANAATDTEVLSALSRAFSNEALAVATRASAGRAQVDANVGTDALARVAADRRRRKAKSMESVASLK